MVTSVARPAVTEDVYRGGVGAGDEDVSGDTPAVVDPYTDANPDIAHFTVLRETEDSAPMLVPTGRPQSIHPVTNAETKAESESSTDEEKIVVEPDPQQATSEPVVGASTRAQRRARRVAAAVRVNLSSSMARVSADGAIIERPVAPLGGGALHALVASTRRWRRPRSVEAASGAAPAAPQEEVE